MIFNVNEEIIVFVYIEFNCIVFIEMCIFVWKVWKKMLKKVKWLFVKKIFCINLIFVWILEFEKKSKI